MRKEIIIHTCDRCGKAVETSNYDETPFVRVLLTFEKGASFHYDLCKDCAQELYELNRTFIGRKL